MFRKKKQWKLDNITEDGIAIYHDSDCFYSMLIWQEEINGKLYIVTESSGVLRTLSQLIERIRSERYELYERLRHEDNWTEWQGDVPSPMKNGRTNRDSSGKSENED